MNSVAFSETTCLAQYDTNNQNVEDHINEFLECFVDRSAILDRSTKKLCLLVHAVDTFYEINHSQIACKYIERQLSFSFGPVTSEYHFKMTYLHD